MSLGVDHEIVQQTRFHSSVSRVHFLGIVMLDPREETFLMKERMLLAEEVFFLLGPPARSFSLKKRLFAWTRISLYTSTNQDLRVLLEGHDGGSREP